MFQIESKNQKKKKPKKKKKWGKEFSNLNGRGIIFEKCNNHFKMEEKKCYLSSV